MSQTKYAIGVDLGGTTVKLGIVSDKGKIVQKIALDTCALDGPEKVVKQIKKGIKELLGNNKRKIEGIGVGAPGLVILKKGTVENPPNLPGWGRVQLGKRLEKEFNYPVFVENDANAAAVGEMIFGAGKKHDNFIMVTLGTGVGGGLILNKKVYRGETGAAGEIGHVSINREGRLCNCGMPGCIEAYAGNNHLVNIVNEQLPERTDSLLYKWINDEEKVLDPKLIHEAAQQDDKFACEVITEFACNLGSGLASIINLLDVSTVIIGGGVAGFGDRLFDAVKDKIKERVLKPIAPRIKVKAARLKNEAGIKGASSLVFLRG
ncbi:MAG: sugar kinase [Melioribacteraceae bacterium]|nr:MAG: sugar kinase [Melioribacteraceae bacterium]